MSLGHKINKSTLTKIDFVRIHIYHVHADKCKAETQYIVRLTLYILSQSHYTNRRTDKKMNLKAAFICCVTSSRM